ncbi:IMPACT family protein [Catalinimonas niigatensis]|uniref:IMPACT family protein n=1 Tax=Catalinimonas niigatensis TaxID=1397264 RepID=UPI002664F540|nr:YigZ family protein [Catalinimonas niigatensis]WPP48206.1 YigZ family protein [Catalinimonas niigatensis]
MTKQDTYYSLKNVSEGLYKEKGSKFLAFAYPVVSEEEIMEKLEALKKQYYDARHHCFAYMLKPEEGREETYRASDDGEPAHSAGDPILGQIRSQKLHDVLVVVVRYFGGTKLGVSGLIQAYKTAAAEAFAHNQIVEKVVYKPLNIRFEYTSTNEVMQILEQFRIQLDQQDYTEDCFYQLSVPRSSWQMAKEQFSQLTGVYIV